VNQVSLIEAVPLSKPYIEKFSATHCIQDFDCGNLELNRFLIRYALQNQQSNSAQSYVACVEGGVVGYYSLSVG
jgi:hypothetical protein